MKKGNTASSVPEKKGHVCPPSDAAHPKDRWETVFVYSFIVKFTTLVQKNENRLWSPMDLEEGLLDPSEHPVMVRVLQTFLGNLGSRKPATQTLHSTLRSVFAEHLKSADRTVFWDDEERRNVDPLSKPDANFYSMDWDIKLKILRVLVELQLTLSPSVKAVIDRAWGVLHNKHKKKEEAAVPPDPSDPQSQESLQLIPLGQDSQRKRYWIVDASPRLYFSTNPWKTSSTFKALSSTKEEYLSAVQVLKDIAPDESKGSKLTKMEQSHLTLITALEARIEAMDAELARVTKAKRKFEQQQLLEVQAALRQTRSRRQTKRPDYTYNGGGSEDDDYNFIDDDDLGNDEFEYASDESGPSRRSRRQPSGIAPRRSARAAALNANGKRTNEAFDDMSEWRGERRSSRLGAPPETQFDAPSSSKRARTDDSSLDDVPVNGQTNNGAPAIKPTEIALETVNGKKKSKYWFYAVEPIPGSLPVVETELTTASATTFSASAPSDVQTRDGMDVDPTTLAPSANTGSPNTDTGPKGGGAGASMREGGSTSIAVDRDNGVGS